VASTLKNHKIMVADNEKKKKPLKLSLNNSTA
jgi:hypothetical protein